VRVPTPEQEEARQLHRTRRRRLVRKRIAHTNRIRGLLAAQGIFDFHPLRADCRERLDALMTGDGRPLGTALRRDILREIERLELVLSQLAAVEAERDAVAAGDTTIGTLMTLRGIGPETATVLTREVFYRESADRRQVAAYAGLTPSPFASGDLSRNRASARPATRWSERPWSNSPGSACAISRTAVSPAGSSRAPKARPGASGGSPSWRSPGSSWCPYGAISRGGLVPDGAALRAA
jgi:transposase